jgi:hypothetical protein
MPLVRPTPHGQLAGDMMNFLGALNQRREQNCADGITGELYIKGSRAGMGRWTGLDRPNLYLPLYVVIEATIANGWTYVFCCN